MVIQRKKEKLLEPKQGFWKSMAKDMRRNWILYLLASPVVIYYIVFHYFPMGGILIAFQNFKFNINYTFFGNIIHGDWVGLDQFQKLFTSAYFKRVFVNTLRLSITGMVFGFPLPIVLAILMNELRNEKFKKTTQVVSYIPHFISLVVVCGMIKEFTNSTGFISVLISKLTGNPPITMLNEPNYFLPVFILSGIWQGTGWSAIIYSAALAGIDQSLYEAAAIDGASRWKQTIHVTIPGILPTIIILLIMQAGSVLSVSFEKVLLLMNDLTASKAEVISTYVYKRGLVNRDWSFSTAVGFFNSVISFLMVMIVNKIADKVTETSLW